LQVVSQTTKTANALYATQAYPDLYHETAGSLPKRSLIFCCLLQSIQLDEVFWDRGRLTLFQNTSAGKKSALKRFDPKTFISFTDDLYRDSAATAPPPNHKVMTHCSRLT
jgi:hypothetical protein